MATKPTPAPVQAAPAKPVAQKAQVAAPAAQPVASTQATATGVVAQVKAPVAPQSVPQQAVQQTAVGVGANVKNNNGLEIVDM